MKSIAINGILREETGKSNARQLRKDEKIPCVIYGGKEQVHFYANTRDFKELIYTSDIYQVNLNINGSEYKTLMKDVQFHPVTDHIIHADFLELQEGKPVIIDIPVRLTGNPAGVLEGGKLIHKTRKMKVKALPGKLPGDITVAIDALNIGDSIKAGDLEIDGVEILESPNTVIALVKVIRAVLETTAVTAAEEGEGEEGAEGAEGAEASAEGNEGEGAEAKEDGGGEGGE